ncbi:MAG: hypothetical protein HY897_11205 [Deltaproteobacteria bacterium]|nr:hypothetical protein [Deltaproteobacteria bacterium]
MKHFSAFALSVAACILSQGCTARFQESGLARVSARFNEDAQDVYIHDPARLKGIKKVIVPDFRVIFPSDMGGAIKAFEGTALQGTTFMGGQGLGVILAEHFEEEILRTRRLEVLERNQLQRILNEMNLQMNGFIDNPNFQPGKLAGADTAILGTVTTSMYYMPNDPALLTMHVLSFRVRVIDLKTGAIILLYRDKQMSVGRTLEQEAIYRRLALRFVEALTKEGGAN